MQTKRGLCCTAAFLSLIHISQCRPGKILFPVAEECRVPGYAAGKSRIGKILDMPHEIAFLIIAGGHKAPHLSLIHILTELAGKYAGQRVWAANKTILADLTASGAQGLSGQPDGACPQARGAGRYPAACRCAGHGLCAVSYTHLDVYKRQAITMCSATSSR